MSRRTFFTLAASSLFFALAPFCSRAQTTYYQVEQVITLTPSPGTPGTDVGYSSNTPNVYAEIETDGITGTVYVTYQWVVSYSSPTYVVVGTDDNVQGTAYKYGTGSPSCGSTCADALGGYASDSVTYTDNPDHYNVSSGKSGPLSPLAYSYSVQLACKAQATDNEGYATATGSVTLISG